MFDRRGFVRLAGMAGGGLALGAHTMAHAGGIGTNVPDLEQRGPARVPTAPRSKRILILGGTGFTGPYQVAYAVARGHDVTVFNRGRSNAPLPDGVRHITGDRNRGDVAGLRDGTWDVVIDNPTTLPFWIRDAAEVLAGKVEQYVMISTVSVYAVNEAADTVDENSPLLQYTDGDPLAVTPQQFGQNVGGLFGPMKAASEAETRKWYADAATIIRPGLIVGPRDSSFRFTYWPWRLSRGGEVLAPGDGLDPVQLIDARDLAEWTIRMVENGTTGTFQASGPQAPLTMAGLIHGAMAAIENVDAEPVWVPTEFLLQQGVAPWQHMPAWLPRHIPDAVIARGSNERAVQAGLTFRALASTAADALEWFNEQPADLQARMRQQAGLTAERETAVLQAWRNSGTSG